MAIVKYLKNRLPEFTTRLGAVITLIPAFFELSQWQTIALFIVAVVLFGVPEDKALERMRRR